MFCHYVNNIFPGFRNHLWSILLDQHSKNNNAVLGMLYLFWVWNENGGSAYFGNFSTLTYVQPHQWKALAETF